MRFIPTKIHGILDYSVGLLLTATPWIVGFARGGSETWIFVIMGVAAILYSLLTDYELGLKHFFSMRTHLFFDVLSGILLASSPWLIGFNDYVYLPHLLFGMVEIIVPLCTKKNAEYEKMEHAKTTFIK